MALSASNFALITLSLLCSFQYVHPAEYVPLFIWGDFARETKSNPLSLLDGEDFENLIGNKLDDSYNVIFVEETLSVEDFSKINTEGVTSYPNLHERIHKATYLPAVSSALHTLNKIAEPDRVDTVKLTEDGLTAEIVPESGKYLFVNLKDAKEGETRHELLKRHDEFMSSLYEKLRKQFDNVVAIYTAHYPSWTIPEDDVSYSRMRRSLLEDVAARNATNATDHRYNFDSSVFLRVQSVALKIASGETVELGVGTPSTASNMNDTNPQVSLTFDNGIILDLNFTMKRGYWYLSDIDVTANGNKYALTNSKIFAAKGFSYHCSQNVLYTGQNSTLNFTNLQVQPALGKNFTPFADAYDCVHFTSIPIWSGLFITFIFLLITFGGIMMMMDIRTMDRFDDPKGKTITINTGE